jgi:hypothetical protein
VWTAIDPLKSAIRLSRECWEDHILVEHPIMRQFAREMRITVQRPDRIFRSKVSKDTRLYFKQYSRKPFGRFYVLVVAKVSGDGQRGFVKTAFLVYNFSEGGMSLWEKS